MSINVLTLNNISSKGLDKFPTPDYNVSNDQANPDLIVLRSYKMHDMDIPANLKAVGRAGAGVNNIPIDKMSEQGIAVFNTPGANANAVKELVIAGILLACRNICQAWDYTRQLEGENAELNKAVEAGKKQYAGFELPGRTLGVIGLGAIGVLVANAARAMGMNVIGYDPGLTVSSAWQLSADVEKAESIDDLLSRSDFVTFHVPLIDATRNLLNAERIAMMPDNATILNFARGGIVDDKAVLDALNHQKLHAYVCDFPTNEIKSHPQVIALPHLGASTAEAEENCAMMVVDQLRDYLENGNIRNSVNLPSVSLPRTDAKRISIVNRNMPDMLAQISHALGGHKVNIRNLVNDSKGNLAYTLIDVDALEDQVAKDVISELCSVEGVLAVRVL